MRSFQKNATFLHFFAFLQKNVAFFAFFYVLQKRTLCSLHSFAFLRKERKSMHRSFGFHKLPKTQKRMQKNIGFFKRMQKNDLLRTRCPTLDLAHLKGQCHEIFDPDFFSSIGYSQAPDPRVGHPFFSKERSVLCILFHSFKKNVPFFVFFSILLKRTERSLRSFPFF